MCRSDPTTKWERLEEGEAGLQVGSGQIAVAEWVRALALNEWRPDILPGRVRLPLRVTLSSELWQFR